MMNHNYADIIQIIYNVVESELPNLIKLSLILYLFIVANNDYALCYWLKNKYIK